MGKTISFAVALVRPWIVRIPVAVFAAIASYDGFSNQFGFPKIPRLWGMTGSLLPWWGWALVAQAILVLALFEYVRRNALPPADQISRVDEVKVTEITERLLTSRWGDIQMAVGDAVSARLVTVKQDIFAHTDKRFESQLKQIAINAGELAGFKAETEKRLLENDYAFAAIGHREILLDRASEIERGSELLDLSSRGGSLVDNGKWLSWEQDYKRWLVALEDWLIFAGPYWHDVQSIKKLPANIHKLSWTFCDNQFPNSAAIHEYRSFCVIHHNWNDIKDKVHAAVRRVAFEGDTPHNAQP